jgi:hypothetical protein
LDPFELHSLAHPDRQEIPLGTDAQVLANSDITFQDDWATSNKGVSQFPLPVVPDFMFNRLAAQNGTFTIHGTDPRSIETIIPDGRRGMLLKFVAKKDRVGAIYDTLDLIRPSSDSIFPDIEGVKDYII